MNFLKIAACAATVAACAAGTVSAGDVAYDTPVDIDLTFLYHIDAEMAEQDIFVQRKPESNEVYRATKGDRNLDQPIFASASAQDHSPFDVNATGPYPKGRPLDMTLRQWFDAKGQGSYRCEDGEGTINVAFEGLVPDGVYTMWHFFMASPPTEPFIGTYDLPVGRRDGSQSVFTAEADGTALFQRSFKPCLQLSGEHLMSGLAVAYHSDGKTYGVEPGEFALNSHIQLFLGLPKRSGI